MEGSIKVTADTNIRLVFKISTSYKLNFSAVNGTVSSTQEEVMAKSMVTPNGPNLNLDGGNTVQSNSVGFSTFKEWQYEDGIDNWVGFSDPIQVNSNMNIRALYTLSEITVNFSVEPQESGHLDDTSLQVTQHSKVSAEFKDNAYYIYFKYMDTNPKYTIFRPYGDYKFKC